MIILCALAVFQGILRIVIPMTIIAGTVPEFENPVSNGTLAAINGIFLLIGVGGIMTAVGLWTGRKWGYTGTMWLSLLTIVFDVWAILVVQPSAILGIVLPVIFMTYLWSIRDAYSCEVTLHESAGGIRN